MRQAQIERIYNDNQGYLVTVARRYSSFLGDGFDDLFQELSTELVVQLKRSNGDRKTVEELRGACKRVISRLLKKKYKLSVPVISESDFEDPAVSVSDLGAHTESMSATALVPDWCNRTYPGLAEGLAGGMPLYQIAGQLGIKVSEVNTVIRLLRQEYLKDGIRG